MEFMRAHCIALTKAIANQHFGKTLVEPGPDQGDKPGAEEAPAAAGGGGGAASSSAAASSSNQHDGALTLRLIDAFANRLFPNLFVFVRLSAVCPWRPCSYSTPRILSERKF